MEALRFILGGKVVEYFDFVERMLGFGKLLWSGSFLCDILLSSYPL